jgi:hypothetical protein
MESLTAGERRRLDDGAAGMVFVLNIHCARSVMLMPALGPRPEMMARNAAEVRAILACSRGSGGAQRRVRNMT